jgi:hypothetical protein
MLYSSWGGFDPDGYRGLRPHKITSTFQHYNITDEELIQRCYIHHGGFDPDGYRGLRPHKITSTFQHYNITDEKLIQRCYIHHGGSTPLLWGDFI